AATDGQDHHRRERQPRAGNGALDTGTRFGRGRRLRQPLADLATAYRASRLSHDRAALRLAVSPAPVRGQSARHRDRKDIHGDRERTTTVVTAVAHDFRFLTPRASLRRFT